jgi:hypothetical protein
MPLQLSTSAMVWPSGLGASAGAPAASAADGGAATATALALGVVSTLGTFRAHPKLESIVPSNNHCLKPRTTVLLVNGQAAGNWTNWHAFRIQRTTS